MVLVSTGWEAFADELRAAMTVDQAVVVEQLRLSGLTWRGVANAFYDRFPEELYGEEMRQNQGAGMLLCEAAAAVLGRPLD